MKKKRWWHPLYIALKHKEPPERFADYTLLKLLFKPVRKWICQVIAPNCVFNNIRVFLYRLCCYLDDMCYDLLKIGNNVTISYGVYFACHGKHQNHFPITIEDGAYIGMRASIISKNAQNIAGRGITIAQNAVVGACALVNKDVPAEATAVGVPCRIILKED